MKHILDRTSFAELRGLFERAQKAKEYARHNPPRVFGGSDPNGGVAVVW